MQNGENIQVLHKNIEFIRFFSILVLLIHFYSACYPAMAAWGVTISFVTHLLFKLSHGLVFLSGITPPKLTALFLLVLAQIGQRGKKDNKIAIRPIIVLLSSGLLLYFLSYYILNASSSEEWSTIIYITVTSIGYLLIVFGSARLSRLISVKMGKDPFNLMQESFPQEERLLENEYSINLRAQYNLKGKIRNSWINIVNPFRALLVCGTPGS
ncbi:YWFCY domain-containing protein [Puia dinghuensis]|uniref:YWFCY domain-containing protein n=1 Tax=Puia dinghuensis TaxID=1792502 RepID=UPI001E2BF5D3|nr:YWFCY domain-containing protein [Puia dinghuensis]